MPGLLCLFPRSPAGGPASVSTRRGERCDQIVPRWGDGTAGADLERCDRRGPPDRGGPDGQQRLHPALPPHRRRHADRRRQRARGTARDLQEPGREPGGGDARALGPHPGRARGARGRHLGGGDQRRRRACSPATTSFSRTTSSSAWATCASRPWPPRATPPAPSASPSRARTSCSRATPSSPAVPATPRFEGADFDTIIRVDRPPDLRRLRARHPGPAGPRHLHHGRERVASPGRMGRARLVRAAAGSPPESSRRPLSKYLTKPLSF